MGDIGFSSGSLKKVFIVAPYQLNINEHFGAGHFDMKGEWKRKLSKQFPKTDLFDSFKDYAARFSDLFGLKEKALSLFNQTVGIKVLGDLTQFIRHQMLEEPEAEEQFKGLYDHYNDLLISHKAIQKDEKQLELLEPVVENKHRLAQLTVSLSLLSFVQEQLPFFLDKIEYDLLDDHITKIEDEIDVIKSEQGVIEVGIKQMEDEQKQLITQKALLNIDSQIQLLNKDKASEIKDKDAKKKNSDDYTNLAGKLGLQTHLTDLTFKENFTKIEQLNSSLTQRYEELTHSRFTIKSDKEKIVGEIDDLQRKITSFLGRKNYSK